MKQLQMIMAKSNLFLAFSFLLICYACNESGNAHVSNSNKKEENKTSELVLVKDVETDVDTDKDVLVRVASIDSAEFYSTKPFLNKEMDNIIKVTDFDEAKKMLEGVVIFSSIEEQKGMVEKIKFRNQYELEINDFFYFIAYFPAEDILLCEGGHSTDISFNLSNGEGTNKTGNLNLVNTSPNQTYRLNGHFEGQECYSYFLQRRSGNQYRKVNQLGDEFEKQTGHWLCTLGETFWTDDSTLYLTETDHQPANLKYFKIHILE